MKEEWQKKACRLFLLKVGIEDYIIVIDGLFFNFLDQPIKNDIKAYQDARKIATGQGDD